MFILLLKLPYSNICFCVLFFFFLLMMPLADAPHIFCGLKYPGQ